MAWGQLSFCPQSSRPGLLGRRYWRRGAGTPEFSLTGNGSFSMTAPTSGIPSTSIDPILLASDFHRSRNCVRTPSPRRSSGLRVRRMSSWSSRFRGRSSPPTACCLAVCGPFHPQDIGRCTGSTFVLPRMRTSSDYGVGSEFPSILELRCRRCPVRPRVGASTPRLADQARNRPLCHLGFWRGQGSVPALPSARVRNDQRVALLISAGLAVRSGFGGRAPAQRRWRPPRHGGGRTAPAVPTGVTNRRGWCGPSGRPTRRGTRVA